MLFKKIAYISFLYVFAWLVCFVKKELFHQRVDFRIFSAFVLITWLVGVVYILFVHFKYKTEYDFTRRTMTIRNWWGWFWRIEAVSLVIVLFFAVISIVAAFLGFF